ncbi:ornithine cyclodeaminase [Bordetella genomosp. 9]|uniref:Ornithine cyclodeaminase n=1 Tax=Bordetella genomosp. 9 TaxID=1416803 RepID=A0A261R9V5_9BORD|nr:ornithine cyclodeaminase family protein [Bordetella genomosp. 9]OZI21462.1 ornithine cyclodeaminase [Bordetella genomosp. 9]
MKFFDPASTADRLSFPALIPALAKMFEEGCVVPRRHTHFIGDRPEAPDTLLLMPAWQEGRYLGVKQVTIYPENAKQGAPGLYSSYTLSDARTGRPLAIIDGDQITVRRTAGASALAASFLARPDARRLVIVGAGNVASALAPAYAAVRDLADVAVWNLKPEKAEALAARLREQGYAARAATDLEQAVREADMVSCATLSRTPLVRRAWLRPGTHVDLIGSFQPTMREADDDTFADTSVFVDTTEALEKSGDLLSPIKAGRFDPGKLQATLETLCRREHPGRRTAEEITVFKSVGTAAEDLAAAILVYESH